MDRLKEGSINRVLTVTVSPAFAAKWLLPRIDRFHSRYPDIDLRLDTQLKPVDFAEQRIDIGVRYGKGNWTGLAADRLMDEEIYPVCSPALLREKGRLRKPSDLARETLIHDLSMDGHEGFPTWSTWLRTNGVANVDARRGMKINNSAAVLQAVIDAQGVALARSVMARDDLAAGRLVRLFPAIAFASSFAYYVVYRAESATLPGVAAFRDWLLDETAPRR
jgi:LysR family transcriptional regulator, glycine cleavage system transcriptional activator